MGRQYYGLDLLKLLAAAAVVAAHTEPLRAWDNGTAQWIFHFIVSMAVPFFFITSGFLLFSRMDGELYSQRNVALVKKTLLRTLRLYLIWHLVYLPVSVYGFAAAGKSLPVAAARFLLNLICVGEQYCSWQLWYLLSSVYALAYLYLALRRKWKLWGILMGTAVYWTLTYLCMVVLADLEDYTGLSYLIGLGINETFGDGRVFTGIGYITIGMLCARYSVRLPVAAALGLGILGAVLAWMGWVPHAIGVMISALGIFLTGLAFSGEAPSGKLLWCREASTVVYFTHMLLFFVGQLVFGQLLGLEYYGIMSFIWSLTTSLLLTAAVRRLHHVKAVRFLFQ